MQAVAVASFADLEQEFLRFAADIVWCTLTTVDTRGRPRSRMVHPIWQVIDGCPVGWVISSKSPVKTRHLAANPYVACSYWSPAQNTVYVDCVASWADDEAGRRHVWDLFQSTPPPLGWDPSPFYGREEGRHPIFQPPRFDAWRVQIVRGEEMWQGSYVGRIWRADGAA